MGHRAERRHAEAAVADRAGRADTAADVCGARAVHRAVEALRAAGAKLHDRASVCRAHDAVCLCRDQALVVDAQQNHRFDELRLNDRAANRHNRLTRENRRTLRHRPDVAHKLKAAQILEKFLAEDLLRAQILDVLLRKGKVLQIIDELLDAGHDGKAAAVRHLSEKHIEITDRILKAACKITVRHRDFVEIRQHGQVYPITAKICVHVVSPAAALLLV